jgi:hypothetical protein
MNTRYFILLIIILFAGCRKKDDPPDNDDNKPKPEIKVPKLDTTPASGLTHFSVVLGGRVIDTADSRLSEQGIVIGISSMPTLSNNFIKISMLTDNSGNFSQTIIRVPANTTFYVRAYGINKQGIGFGNEVTFQSLKERVYDGWGTAFVFITTQQELIDFGKNNYTTVNKNIIIEGPITDLSPLDSLVVLNGGLTIKNTNLTNLKGLDNLEVIGDQSLAADLRIENNASLQNLGGLNKLKFNKGYFYLINNKTLTDLHGLDIYIGCYGGEFRISGCDKLQSLHGLESITHIGGSLYLMDNPSLNNIKALDNIQEILESIFIINNNSLIAIDAFTKIRQLSSIDISNNSLLTNMNGLCNIESLISINLIGNNSLNNLSAFVKIKSLPYLTIHSNNSLTNLEGFNNLEKIEGKLIIQNNSSLTNFCALKLLTGKVCNYYFIDGNASNPGFSDIAVNCK